MERTVTLDEFMNDCTPEERAQIAARTAAATSRETPSLPVDYDLTCWYINQRRVLELVGVEALSGELRAVEDLSGNEYVRSLANLVAFKDTLTRWLRHQKPPTLGQILIGQEPRAGVIFTHYTNWFCKGLGGIHRALGQGKSPVSPALAHAKLDDLREGWRVECRFHHDHLTSSSSWHELSGQKPLLVIGLITGVVGTTIEAIPYVIANPVPALGRPQTSVGRFWFSKLECHIDAIDSFAAVRDVPPTRAKRDLELLKAVPENAVKAAFAEIIGELAVPNDWGGERSDLFSDRVVLGGARISTAFAFKGPAQFRPMTMAQLGQNGDQIDRLFSEPADLLVLQHCHEITPPVRGAMRAYAQQMGNPRLFCLIDGYDTLRLLKAYKQCGL